MSEKAMEIISKMSDLEAVRFLEHLGKKLFEGTSTDAVINSVTPELRDLPELREIDSLDGETRKRRLDPADSARIARITLEQIALDDGLSDVLIQVWKEYDPKELFIEMILPVGLVASMMLLVATTEIDIEFKGVKIKKGKATAEQIKAIAGPFFSAVSKMLGI